jgi:putative ABC transport system permease protein
MKNQPENIPPKAATRFLRWYCRAELLEDLEGDLSEYFNRNCRTKPVWRAKLIYFLDVLKFLRLYTLRKPQFINTLIHWLMLSSYIKTSGRSIVRNKLFSSLNIIGLAISMSVGLVLIAFLTDLLSYDQFHVNGDRIYRVNSQYFNLGKKEQRLASNSIRAGKRIDETIAGIDHVVIFRREFGGDARNGEKVIPISGLYASENVFDVFTFPFIDGNPSTALKEPYSIVLTQKSATRIFGQDDAVGKTIMFDTIAYQVTGVLQDIPKFSHMQFESLVSLSTFETRQQGNPDLFGWGNIWMNYVYILLPEKSNPESLQASLDHLATEENKALEHNRVELWLQPMNNIALGENLNNQIGRSMIKGFVYVIIGLALIVILSACFNYTNLSIARSIRRSKEVGVRKVIGALRSHVVAQFITEAVIISFMSLVLSLGLFLFLRPQFLSIAPELAEMVDLELTLPVFGYFVLLALAVGISAGLLPAIFFSKVNAIQVLKNMSSVKVFKHVSLRKAMIIVQYTFSLMFIAATVIGLKQYKYFLSFDLGFNTENILNIRLQGNKPDLIIKELKEFPEVTGISKSLMITNVGSYYGANMKYIDPLDSATIFYNGIDENYMPLHGHKLQAGRNFNAKTSAAKESEVIVNFETLKRFKIGNNDPQKALGEVITVDGMPLTIIGVLKDFHYGKADSEDVPVIFRYKNVEETNGYINARISTTDLPSTMNKIESAWKKVDKVHPLTANFYDEQIERAYSEFSAMLKMIGFLSFLAVSIASMGLLGMVVFTTETRLREMSIRKVLGASERNLIYLLSRGFLVMLAISAFIALPATYLFFENMVLSHMANRAPIGVVDLLFSLSIVLVIALLMIGSQTLKVAKANPAQVLKSE